MSFTELAELTANLGQTEGPASPTIEKLRNDVADLTSAVRDLKDSHKALLEHVTAIARHVVRSPDRSFPDSNVLAPFAAPLARTASAPADFANLSQETAPVVNTQVRVSSIANLPRPPVVPTDVVQPATVAQHVRHPQLDFKFTIKDALATLQTFSGGSDRSGDVLDDGTFIAFQDWFSASTWKLTAAGVPLNTHAAIMAQKLIGPIQLVCGRAILLPNLDFTSASQS
jgi:hypothetical protein